jgi:hypothetical protein
LKKQKQKQTPQQQAAAFRKAARELGADKSEQRFQDALRTVAKHKPLERPEGKKGRADKHRD